MNNGFSTIVAILISVIAMFIFPTLYMAQKQDAMTQTYVLTETAEFVNTIKNTGCIRKNVYEAFIKRLDRTNNIYNIEIEHQHLVLEPIYKNGVFANDYVQYYNGRYSDDIKKAIEEENIYKLSQGDYISIRVVNRNKTYATKLQNLTGVEVPTEQISVAYGGEIRDEDY